MKYSQGIHIQISIKQYNENRNYYSQNSMGRGILTRPIWKCPCIKLFITYFRHLEKIHPYWPETK